MCAATTRAAAPAAARRPRRLARRLAMLVAAGVASVLAAELALLLLDVYAPEPRAWPGQHVGRPHPRFEPDPVVGWRMKPGIGFATDGEGGVVHYRADAAGRRVGADDAAAARPHTIVLAGDSFVWGAGVQHEDSLAGRLEARYPRARVVNLAQPGFGVDQIMLAVVRQGLPLRPDLVVVGVYPQDCSRSLSAFRADMGFEKPTFRLAGGGLAPLTAADRPPAPLVWLEQGSRLFGLWRRAQRNVGFEHGVGPWWALNRALLEELGREVAARGVPLLVLHVPLHDWRPFVGLTAWCTASGVALIDPVAREATKPAGMYYEPDGHLTASGHRWFEDAVAAWIARQDLPFAR